MTLERAIQVLQTRQRWRESERKDRLQCWPGSQHELNSIEESRAVDALLTAIAALEAQATRKDCLQVPDTGDTAVLDALLNDYYAAASSSPEDGVPFDYYLTAKAAIHAHMATVVQAEREKTARDMADYMPPVPPPATTRHE